MRIITWQTVTIFVMCSLQMLEARRSKRTDIEFNSDTVSIWQQHFCAKRYLAIGYLCVYWVSLKHLILVLITKDGIHLFSKQVNFSSFPEFLLGKLSASLTNLYGNGFHQLSEKRLLSSIIQSSNTIRLLKILLLVHVSCKLLIFITCSTSLLHTAVCVCVCLKT